MTRITIIPEDGFIAIGEVFVSRKEGFPEIDADIRVVQFNGEKCHIETQNGKGYFVEDFNFQPFIDFHNAAFAANEAAKAEEETRLENDRLAFIAKYGENYNPIEEIEALKTALKTKNILTDNEIALAKGLK